MTAHPVGVDAMRADRRLPAQLRPMATEAAPLHRADGSARFSHDKTAVLAAVYGPCEVKRSRERIDSAALDVIVRPAAGLPGAAEREMEQLLSATLQHAILISAHPRTAISIVIQVCRDDGSLLSAVINAACVALVQAGVPLCGMLAGCCIAVLPSGEALLDPTAEEQREADSVSTYAYLIRQPEPSGSAERRLLLSHVQGVVTQIQNDMLLGAAQEAAACTAAFCRQALHQQRS